MEITEKFLLKNGYEKSNTSTYRYFWNNLDLFKFIFIKIAGVFGYFRSEWY